MEHVMNEVVHSVLDENLIRVKIEAKVDVRLLGQTFLALRFLRWVLYRRLQVQHESENG